MNTKSFLTRLAVSLLAVAAFNSANAISSLDDPMDTIGSWQLGGGANATDRTLAIDTTNVFEGTGSLKIEATYQAGGNAYSDMYETVSPVDLSGGSLSLKFDLLSSSTNLTLQITIGSSADNKYFNATYTPTTSSWESVSLDLSSFGDTIPSTDLSSIDFYRIRVIGDGLGTFPQTVSVNIDNLQAVPEPTSLAMVTGGGLVLLAAIRRFRRSSMMFPAILVAMLPAWQLRADPVSVAPEKFVPQIQEEKGSAVGSSEWKLTDAKPAELEWKVCTSPAQGFDFARLSFPVSFQVAETSFIVLTGSLQLATDNYFGIELIAKDGTMLYTAISTVEENTSLFQIPMTKFSVENGKCVKYPVDIVTVRLMFSGDKSPVAGDNVLKVKTLGVQ